MRIPRWWRFIVVGAMALGLFLLLRAAIRPLRRHYFARSAPARIVDYTRHIKPILEARCYRCHGPSRHKAGLRLDSPAFIRKGSSSGAVIVRGDAAKSLLIEVVSSTEDRPRMPPTGEPLSTKQILLLKAWIDAGAPAPYEKEDSQPARHPHWAFQPPVLPPVPARHDLDGASNPIDAFLAAQREQKGLTPRPPVAKGLLFRRVCIDLVGLPPTRDELRAFLADSSEEAYAKAVDRLLASPRYGERWARHWMDIWRYSDPDGRKAKRDIWWSNEFIWRWRNWIIQSLNEDKGYDRMVMEMLAGDEIAPDDPETLAATGFLVRNWFKLSRNITLNNTIEHTAKAFLGLTIHCARCHDHKFDPISQKEYYRFRAFFEPYDIRTDGYLVDNEEGCTAVAYAYDARPDAPTWIFWRGDEKNPDKKTPITPGVPAAVVGPPLQITPVKVCLDGGERTSTGRRLALARWLCDRKNPLTARVAVNHVWARHFGRPLVENVHDFGMRTKPPVQQPLLDWLAVEFMAHDWSLKWLHRIIVTSAAYRMDSSALGGSAQNLTADPDNQYYWRMNPRQMEAEVVRDSLLYLAGDIDGTMGGPPLDCLAGPDSPRRSLYYRYSREDKMEFLTVFDAAAVEECYRRRESIVPQQALALENSDFVWNRARRIARRLEQEGEAPSALRNDAAFITAAFENLLSRPPKPAELEACEQFLARQEKLLADRSRLTRFPPLPPPPPPPNPHRVPGLPLVLGTTRKLPRVAPAEDYRARARESLIHALLNHHDFIAIR
jgi:hypothetical protein